MIAILVVILIASLPSAFSACGTSKKDISCLASKVDYFQPEGTPCVLPQCPNGKLPWNIFYQVCGPLVQHNSGTCGGAMICQQWAGGSGVNESASLGSYSTASYMDATSFDGVVLRADQVTFCLFVFHCGENHFDFEKKKKKKGNCGARHCSQLHPQHQMCRCERTLSAVCSRSCCHAGVYV